MELTLEQYESIQNYLDGLMTPEELEGFLNELHKNSFLRESLEFEKELRQNLTSLLDKKNLLEKQSNYFEEDAGFEDAASIRSLIEKSGNEWKDENKRSVLPGETMTGAIHNKRRPQKAKIISMQPWIIATAAACIFIAVVSLKWFIQGPSISPSIVQTRDTSVIKKDTTTGTVKTNAPGSVKNIQSPAPKIDFARLV